ncbi:MAG: hypothetical protein JWP03_2416, partial [Phycisphaerales bacterium]|nr:hypothetical protein [Phycisphaerales bacterium]
MRGFSTAMIVGLMLTGSVAWLG